MNNIWANSRNTFSTRLSTGFTLIEVMVAMLILSTGILGLAYLQNLSVQFGQDSYSRSQIMFSANQLIDSMRVMQISPDDGSGDHTDYTTTPGANPTCSSTASSAQNDVNCFFQEVSRTLPFGTAQIGLDGNNYLITVFWSERGLNRDSGETLAQSDCNNSNVVGLSRMWSSTLAWPYGNSPDSDICMVSRSWSVEIFNSAVL